MSPKSLSFLGLRSSVSSFFAPSPWREIAMLICFIWGRGGLGRSSRFAFSVIVKGLSWTIGRNHWREVVGIMSQRSQKGLLTCCFVSIFLRASGSCIVTAWMPSSQVWPLWFYVYSLTYKEKDFMYPPHLAGPSCLSLLVYASIKFQRKGVCVWSPLRFSCSLRASPSSQLEQSHFRWQLAIFMVMAILSLLLGDINCPVTVH